MITIKVPSKKIDEITASLLKEALDKKMPHAKISEELGISIRSILRYIKKYNLKSND